jgi:NAD(P)-dependent dehydrogenase (short-subunit alcohol dehydrogenase family)
LAITSSSFKVDDKNNNFLFIHADITDPEQCKMSIQLVIKKFGRIDTLINNVGVNDNVPLIRGADADSVRHKPPRARDDKNNCKNDKSNVSGDNTNDSTTGRVEEFVQSLRLNLIPAFSMTYYALPWLIASTKEDASNVSIVNILSKVFTTGQGGTSGYAASKGGLASLTREWAVDLLPFGIRVNAIVPAEVKTSGYMKWLSSSSNVSSADAVEERLKKIEEKIPLGRRMTRVEEIAKSVVFLASSMSSHTTGQFLYVDGGYTHLDRALAAANNNDDNNSIKSKL